MVNFRRVGQVARFEVVEALHSRLLALLALLYGGGAMLGSSIFLNLLRSAEEATRSALSKQMGLAPSTLSDELVRENAMPWLVQLVEDESTRQQLLQMDPLSIFFGFATLQTVWLLVLLGATGSITRDLAQGAARFVLPRCDRLSWTLGKTLGQALLLGGGLLIAALASAAVGSWIDEQFEATRWVWMLRTAFRSWIFGLAYLGVFMGLSMLTSTPLRARALAVLVWFGMSIGHALLTATWLDARVPGIQVLAWLLPGHHEASLWSGDLAVYSTGILMLLLIASLGFGLGYRLFERRDA